jgi:hypothetical protein
MKLNKKVVDLISEGFKANTLKNMTESQIDILHKRISESNKKEQKEQSGVVKQTKTVTTTKIPRNVAQTQGVDIANKGMVNVKTDTAGNVNVAELSERKVNPWAVCTDSVGRKDKQKYERCVQDVKKKNKGNLDLGEEKNLKEDLFLEEKILNLVKNYIEPKISKKEFLSVMESEETKTKEKPDVKEKPGTKSPTREKPFDPYKPAPHKQPKPKAKVKKSETKEEVMDAPVKNRIKSKGLPQMLKFKSLGIKFKK